MTATHARSPTGDMIHMGLWIGMGLVALIALLVVLWKNRKK